MPIFVIKHVTTYRYRQPVAFGEHRMMLRPRDDGDQIVLAGSGSGDAGTTTINAGSGDSLTVITNASTVLALPTSTTPTVTFTGDFTGSAAGLTNVPIGAIIGGLTTTLPVLVPGGHTNTLVFQNGILIRVQ